MENATSNGLSKNLPVRSQGEGGHDEAGDNVSHSKGFAE
jgi:hypothetical protein